MGSTKTLERGRELARAVLTSRTLLGIIAVFAVANVIMFGIQRWFVLPLHVPSASMEPALQRGDRILVRRNHDSAGELARRIDRGDVLVFRAPHEGRPLVVKRIIGLPGETIRANNGPIEINARTALVEKWLPESERGGITIKPTVIGRDEVYVLGDNRDGSIDSRTFGVVKLDDVVGTVLVRFWPVSRVGTVDWI